VKLTDTHYTKFSPGERIALFWEAMGRADHAEADRLIDTCPEKTYRMQDLAYFEGVRAIHYCCIHALLMIEQAAGKMLSSMGLALWTLDTTKTDVSDLVDKACEAYALARGRLLGYWEAWCDFCEGVGVDPEAVMRASWSGVPKWITEPLVFPEVDELIEPDPEAKASALDLFRHRWKVYRERNGLRG
jgi:hypothetical protein